MLLVCFLSYNVAVKNSDVFVILIISSSTFSFLDVLRTTSHSLGIPYHIMFFDIDLFGLLFFN